MVRHTLRAAQPIAPPMASTTPSPTFFTPRSASPTYTTHPHISTPAFHQSNEGEAHLVAGPARSVVRRVLDVADGLAAEIVDVLARVAAELVKVLARLPPEVARVLARVVVAVAHVVVEAARVALHAADLRGWVDAKGAGEAGDRLDMREADRERKEAAYLAAGPVGSVVGPVAHRVSAGAEC